MDPLERLRRVLRTASDTLELDPAQVKPGPAHPVGRIYVLPVSPVRAAPLRAQLDTVLPDHTVVITGGAGATQRICLRHEPASVDDFERDIEVARQASPAELEAFVLEQALADQRGPWGRGPEAYEMPPGWHQARGSKPLPLPSALGLGSLQDAEIALIERASAWQLPIFFGYGSVNSMPEARRLAAFLRHWEQAFAATLVAMMQDTLLFEVARPPTDPEVTAVLARAHYVLGDWMGVELVHVARSLLGADRWELRWG